MVLALVPAARAQQDSAATAERFLQAAPSKWLAYRNAAGRFQLQATMVARAAGGEKTHCKFEYKVNESCWSYVHQSLEHDRQFPEGFAYVVNDKYAFKLQRKTAESPWTLTELLDRAKESELPRGFLVYQTMATSLLLMPIDPTFENWSELIQKVTFRIKRAYMEAKDTRQIVKIEFENDSPSESTNAAFPSIPAASGELHLDPQLQWLPVHRVTVNKWGSRNVEDFEYAESGESFPMLKHFTAKRVWPPKENVVRSEERDITCTFSEPERLPKDDEFRLTAFGIPEPVWVKEREKSWRPPLYAWLVGIGILCLVAGLILRRRTQHA